METSQSPRKAMRQAWELACRVWPKFSHPCSRHDFTLPQLFACLVVREMLKLSYRKAEALLRDSPSWLAEIELDSAPDHNTLWRALGLLLQAQRVNRMLDLLSRLFAEARVLQLGHKPLSIDSSCYEPRHRSKHYDRVCRRMNLRQGQTYTAKSDREVNRSRSQKVRQMPKLALATASACHVILAIRAHIGHGSDMPDFVPLLKDSCHRAQVRTVVADAGYDSESNHCSARHQQAVRSVIPPRIGRRTSKPPVGHYRCLMRQRFDRKADRRLYGQRSQSETVNSMLKRNFGDALRSVRAKRRKQELNLRAIAHDILLAITARDG